MSDIQAQSVDLMIEARWVVPVEPHAVVLGDHAVVVDGGVFTLPEHFRDWVRPGGRLFAFVGESPVLRGILHERLDESHWRNETLFETDLPYLQHAEPPRRFAL